MTGIGLSFSLLCIGKDKSASVLQAREAEGVFFPERS